MRLAVLAEGLHHLRVGLVVVGLEGVDDQPETAVGHDCPLERRISLEANDDFVVAIDVARHVSRDRTRYLGDVEDPFLALLDKQALEDVPDVLGP